MSLKFVSYKKRLIHHWRHWRHWRLLVYDVTTEKVLDLGGMFGRVRDFYYLGLLGDKVFALLRSVGSQASKLGTAKK